MVTKTQLLNLKPIKDSKRARELGRIGGRKRSLKKRLAAVLNATKHAKYTKNEIVIKAITPTPAEKAAGITKDDKLEIIKKIAPALTAENAMEFFKYNAETLATIKTKIIQLEREYEKLSEKEKQSKKGRMIRTALWWWLQYYDREQKFGEVKFGLNKINIQQNQINIDQKISITELMHEICGNPDDDDYLDE